MRQLHCGIVLLVMWIALHSPLQLSAAADEGFTPLFNGRNLQGWVAVGPAEAFIVRGSAIFSTGAGPYPSWLRSEREYENFVLRFEYQTEGWYEGGILLHAPLDGPARSWDSRSICGMNKRPTAFARRGPFMMPRLPVALPIFRPGSGTTVRSNAIGLICA